MKLTNSISKAYWTSAAILAMAVTSQATETPQLGQGKELVPVTDNWPVWHFSLTEGVQSEYIYRGNNLTPGAGGFLTNNLQTSAEVGKGQNLTFGAWGGVQLGSANYAGFPPTLTGNAAHGQALSHLVGTNTYMKETVSTHQTAYRELDLFVNYRIELDPVLVGEVGDIAYFSTFESTTVQTLPAGYHFTSTGSRYLKSSRSGPHADNTWDEVYLSLGANPKWYEYAVPKLTLFQSVYQTGLAPKGGYLEGRVDGYVPILKQNDLDFLCVRPYFLLSVSYDSQTEATGNYGRRYFTGWNNTELGFSVPLCLNKHFTITGFTSYSHKLTTPNQATDRNEVWGGAGVTVNF